MSKKCTPLWCEANFEVKMYKTPQVRTTFGRSDVEKVRAMVARSTCGRENVKFTARTGHFWKLRCGRSARRCGAKHIFGSQKCQKTWGSGHFLTSRLSFDVEKVHAVVARSTFPSKNVQITACSGHFWKLRC